MAEPVVAVLQVLGFLAAGIAVAVLVKVFFLGHAPAKRNASADAHLQAHQQAVRGQSGGFGPPAG